MKKTIMPGLYPARLIAVILIITLCMSAGNLAAQTIRYVKPASAGDGSSWDQASGNLQLMINNSDYGDLVFVAAGTYETPALASYSMKNGVKIYGGFAGTETLLSQRDWTTNVTILKGNGRVAVRNFRNGVTTASVLDGFTLTCVNNSTSNGGGMHNDLASPTVANCSFTGSRVTVGGGMCNDNSSPHITDCSFSGNAATSSGGGIYNEGSSPVITNCSFTGNESVFGGGMFNRNSSPVITNSSFETNNAKRNQSNNGGYGGGIYNDNSSSPSLSGCSFITNNAYTTGGGIYSLNNSAVPFINCSFTGNTAIVGGGMCNVTGSPATIINCTFTANGSAQQGGAIVNVNNSNSVVFNCAFSGNTAFQGGAMDNAGSYPTITNCIFSGNKAFDRGGSMYNGSFSSPAIFNCTFSGNNSPIGGVMYNEINSGAVVHNSIIWGNSSAILDGGHLTTLDFSIIQGGYTGIGNLDVDPLFINAPDYTTAPFTDGNYRIRTCSPASNAGSDAFVPAGIATDFAGNPRINMTVDMGAYEYAVQHGNDNTLYVNPGISSGAGNGNSWTNALSLLAEALLYAKANETNWSAANPLRIFVATGTYKPLYRPDNLCTNASDRDNTFLISDNVQIYGGFDPANGIDDLTDTRIFGAGGSILSGDIGTANNNSDNCYHVLTFSGVGNFARLDGLTITGGNANGSGRITVNGGGSIERNNGGGIYLNGSSPIIANSILSGNTTSNYGGGIYSWGGSFPAITNCTFLSNTAGLFGAGMFSEPAAAPTITSSLFAGNNTQFGGALYNGGNAIVTSCSFSNNWAASYGGAVYNGGLSPVYTNCIFSGNVAVNTGGGGGAMFNNNANASVINNTFSGNNATFGGAIHNFNSTSATIRNSVIWGNNSGIYNESTAAAAVNYTLIQGGYTGTGNLNINPQFSNAAVPAGVDGIWGSTDDGLRPQVCSPVINAGNNGLITAGITTDVFGHSRVQLATVDLGAYEANSFANAAVANIATSNTVTSGWQIRNGQTLYATNCTTLTVSVTGDGSPTSISGNTTAKLWIESSQPVAFVKRHYEIAPLEVNPTTATGIITLYFTQAEFNDFNAINSIKLPQGPADAAGKANLLIEKRGGISNNNTGLPNSYSGTTATINPIDANIGWNATNLRWEISFPVTGFSGFFVKTQSFNLPLRLVNFTAEEHNCVTTLQWITKDEVNVSHFEAEQSSDGISFNIIKTISAKNTGSENKYGITVPVTNDRIYYRLKMVDIDGKITYSPVMIVTSSCGNKILVTPNPAIDRLYIRNASVGSRYSIYDNTGRRMSNGLIINAVQEVYITSIPSGIYYISITDKNGSIRKVSFLKE